MNLHINTMNIIRNFFLVVLAVTALIVSGCATTTPSKSQSAVDLVELANSYYERGLLSDAEAKYRRITLAYPKYHEAWLKLGNIYVRTDQLEAAITAYEACGERQPKDIRCWNNLALARIKQAVGTLDQGKSAVRKGSHDFASLEHFQRRLINVLAPQQNQ